MANVTSPSIQAVYANVTFNATNPGVPPTSPSNATDAPGDDNSAQLPQFPIAEGVYSRVSTHRRSNPCPMQIDVPVARAANVLRRPHPAVNVLPCCLLDAASSKWCLQLDSS